MYLFLQLMRVTILQTDIIWGSPQDNMERAERQIKRSAASDLFVLPEMWSTGFATEPEGIADEKDMALSWMQKIAVQTNTAICGSVSVKEDDHYVNRLYFVRPDQTYDYYDKHHLFTYGKEDKFYKSGAGHTIVNYEGFRFLLLTCYDLRFPIWSRYADALQFDAIICVANWPSSRQNAWQILTRARAIENQAYLIACNLG